MKAPLVPIVTERAWEWVEIDLIYMRHEPSGQFKWILHIKDHFSKYTQLYPLKSKHAELIAEAFALFIAAFLPPNIVQADNGKEFKGALLILLRKYGIQVINGAPRSPQTQGLPEPESEPELEPEPVLQLEPGLEPESELERRLNSQLQTGAPAQVGVHTQDQLQAAPELGIQLRRGSRPQVPAWPITELLPTSELQAPRRDPVIEQAEKLTQKARAQMIRKYTKKHDI
ncbi:hypothetical protein V502_02250 [Pseudogymnoascus sp. VKM F-4520 (FW-2644)]|nr:hypothetical protein V502_02250 [Pseudogymnoascus sp. VKM F-4520 (FW-2644)]